jgi:hypothetical protein
MGIGVYMAMADAEAYVPRESPFMGLTDTRCASLRAYQRYSKNATVDVPDLYGRLRWMGQKQARIHAIVHRLSSSHETTTMHAIAKEASCAPSTVSRAILKFQSWGMFAIDVKRGRGGGISVRLRTIGDQLAAYAERAWARLRRAAERVTRTLVNVASTQDLEENVANVSTSLVVDATFMEAWDAAERDGARLLAESRAANASVSPLAGDGGFDPGNLTAENVIRARFELDRDDPDWDLQLDYVRASYGMKQSIED